MTENSIKPVLSGDRPRFGPGGNSTAFYDAGCKSTKEAPAWLHRIGLDAYEFEASRGVNASEETLRFIGREAAENDIRMSVHAPYFISLSGTEIDKRLKSLDYIRDSLRAAALLGAEIIVVHTGSASKISRREAMELASDTLCKALADIPDNGVAIGLETMGKQNQLGTLDEVIELCKIDKRLSPVVDFGHLNARATGGVFPNKDAYRSVFDKIAGSLGDEKAKNLHCHFSKIEWTASGEKRHLTFSDNLYGPAFEPLMECIYAEGVTPVIICESAGTMSDDALQMKTYYERIRSWKN